MGETVDKAGAVLSEGTFESETVSKEYLAQTHSSWF